MAKVTGQQLVNWFMRLRGKPYVFGTEQDGKPPDKITSEDCSEGTQNTADQNGVIPHLPDGARNQWRHCRDHGLEISLEDAYTTPGALLFRITPDGDHVAMVRGVKGRADKKRDGSPGAIDNKEHWLTIEARGKAWGVGCWEADRPGFMFAALIPGVDYGPEWE